MKQSDMPEMIKPDGSRGVPQSAFPCSSVLSFPLHYLTADKLFWWDGEDTEEQAGWYCFLCHPIPNAKGWRLIDELLETGLDIVRII